MTRFFAFIAIILILGFVAPCARAQVNRNANERTKNIYNYINALKNQGPYNRLLLGQHATSRLEVYKNEKVDLTNDWLTWLTYFDELYWGLAKEYKDNQHLALVGVDFGVNQPAEDPTGIPPVANSNSKPWYATRDAETFAGHGCLVTASWHVNNPWTEKDSKDRTKVDLKTLLPGGTCRAIWLSKLDVIAAELQILQVNERTVLWRPLHEMNADWFWWGKAAPADFKALWEDMYNYFTNIKHLNNLIWVYTPYNIDAEDRSPYSTYYPGDKFVDIVGVDIYDDILYEGGRVKDPLEIHFYESLKAIAPSKPLICGELGPNEIKAGANWNHYLDQLQTKYPEIVIALAWNDWFDDEAKEGNKWTYKSIFKNEHAGVLKHKCVITREELPPF